MITLFLELLILLVAIVLLFGLRKSKVYLRKFNVFSFWNGFAVLIGFGFAYFLAFLNPLLNNIQIQNPGIDFLAGYFLKEFIKVLGTDGIIEEPIYRGFLWGALRNYGWEDKKIFLFQAFLFWLSHANYWDHPYTFWIVAPLISLLLGILAWKSKSIVPPMIAHVIYNAFVATYVER